MIGSHLLKMREHPAHRPLDRGLDDPAGQHGDGNSGAPIKRLSAQSAKFLSGNSAQYRELAPIYASLGITD
jgi:hypothetical protein